ncbi:MAG: hypothetical protein AB8G16_15315 [Gammaproteobacteria bacterium]
MNTRIARIALAVTLSMALTACTAQKPITKLEPTTATQKLDPGLSHLWFNDWAGPEVPVWVYVPHSANPKSAPIMFMLHGAKRGAARYLSEWDNLAEEHGFIVVAPEFTRDNFATSRRYNSGNVFEKDGTRNPENVWSFSAIEPIFDRIKADLGSAQTHYTMFGHSAGSQFVHRFMFYKTDTRAKRFLLANAGWYTMPDRQQNHPYGLRNTGVSQAHLEHILKSDVVVLLGDQDNDAAHESLRRTPEANVQGPHRFARGQSFFAAGKRLAQEQGIQFGWRLRVVPGVAHSNGGIAQAAFDLVD